MLQGMGTNDATYEYESVTIYNENEVKSFESNASIITLRERISSHHGSKLFNDVGNGTTLLYIHRIRR